MKKYIYQLLCSLFIGATMVACAEDYMETDKGHDTLTLSVNQQELVLNEKNHSQEALALSSFLKSVPLKNPELFAADSRT